VASDENETRLPAEVERALAKARADASRRGTSGGPSAGGGSSGRWLAFVPVSVAALMFLLMMPRAAPPDDVPIPELDARALLAAERDDAARAALARTERLPDDVLAVGSALRAVGKAQVHTEAPDDVTNAKTTLDHALGLLLSRGDDEAKIHDQLKTLRAVQLDAFLAEVAKYEETGKATTDLEELGGAFVERMTAAGWIEDHRVLLTEHERRAAYKAVWTALVGGTQVPALALTLDEQRALYTLYLARPHAPEAQRAAFVVQRKAATTPEECERAQTAERVATEMWRADKIRRLGEIDPEYPTFYALGVAYYRAGRYDQSVEAFRAWVDRHPDGPWSLRARNHLKAALAAYGP